MQPRDIGLRAQDIQTGLQEVDLRGPASGLLDTTLLVGMAARLAIHIRGADIVDDPRRLLALGTRLGIDSLVLPNVVRLLEEAEFVHAEYDGERLKRVVERVPYFEDIYSSLGVIWGSRKPSEEETASIQLLDDLTASPQDLSGLKATYGLGDAQLSLIREIGGEGGYLSEFISSVDGSIVVYSPLYWEENPEATFKLMTKYGGARVAKAILNVRSHQGMPVPDATADCTEDDKIVLEAMVAGLLPAPEVQSSRGAKRFAFTPYRGSVTLTQTERAILQKARAILACVRYGQNFGLITRIGDPEAIIRALVTRGRIGPHSEIAAQYAILVLEGVARVSRDTHFRDRYHLEIVETPENKRALEIAADLLKVGEAITGRGLDSAARGILFNGGLYKEPLTARAEDIARRKQRPQYSPGIVRAEIEALVDDIRGM